MISADLGVYREFDIEVSPAAQNHAPVDASGCRDAKNGGLVSFVWGVIVLLFLLLLLIIIIIIFCIFS